MTDLYLRPRPADGSLLIAADKGCGILDDESVSKDPPVPHASGGEQARTFGPVGKLDAFGVRHLDVADIVDDERRRGGGVSRRA